MYLPLQHPPQIRPRSDALMKYSLRTLFIVVTLAAIATFILVAIWPIPSNPPSWPYPDTPASRTGRLIEPPVKPSL
jgi:hypothetical protein